MPCSSSTSTPARSLAQGDVFTLSKRFSEADVAAWAAVTGDSNPIHTRADAAVEHGLPAPVLPGLLSASLFPAIIGSHFPGAVYLTQTLKFKQFALVGDTVTATITVERCSGSRVSFLTTCRRSRSSPGSSGSGGTPSSTDRASASSISSGAAAIGDRAAGEVVVEGTALALIPPE